jgi:DNA modification methylase
MLTLEYLDPATLTPQPANPWNHPQIQADALQASIDGAGWAGAALMNRATGRLIDGHLRREEAIRRGEALPTLVGEWSEAQERLLLRTINPLAQLAQENSELLAQLDTALAADFDAGALAPDERLTALLTAIRPVEPPAGPTLLTDPDEIPEAAPTRCKPGDLWALGPHRIMCASVTDAAAVERLMGGEKAAVMVTSPPYYGLRAYGTEGQVWGGREGCEHSFEEHAPPSQGGQSDFSTSGLKRDGRSEESRVRTLTENAKELRREAPSGGATCTLCGAWRGELGLEPNPALYVEHMTSIFRDLKRVLKDDGCAWVNMGDSYASSPTGSVGDPANQVDGVYTRRFTRMVGHTGDARRAVSSSLPAKNLLGMPWRLAFALQDDGWILRSDVIWAKPNPMPESVTDRPTKAHEYLFLLSQRGEYFYDADAVREDAEYGRRSGFRSENYQNDRAFVNHATTNGGTVGGADPSAGRNLRTVWTIPPRPFAEAHFATFPLALVEPCLLAGTSAAGACPHCGLAWERVVERGEQDRAARAAMAGNHLRGNSPEKVTTGNLAHRTPGWQGAGYTPQSETLGWRPACRCPKHDPIPQIIFDPFCGAATVIMAAELHGRRGYGIELSPAYCDIAIARWEAATGRTAERLP